MNVIVKIDGREAIPIRAIPLLTDWKVWSPDKIANLLGGDEDSLDFHPSFGSLVAYRLQINGEHTSISADWWKSWVARPLAATSDRIESEQISHESGYQQWRKESLALLPPGSFLWRDEFERVHMSEYGPGSIRSRTGKESFENGLHPLNFSPQAAPSFDWQTLVHEGFEQLMSTATFNLLESKEVQRIEKGEPTSLTTIAEVWAERRINVGLASFIEVHSLTKQLSRQLQRLVRDGKLMVYETFLQRERPYEAEDEPDLASGRIHLLPRNVNAWMEKERLSPTLTTPDITPPEGWKEQSPQGLQRSSENNEGRLVRLADLVQWLMDARELPCKGAVEMMCSVFEKHPSAAGRWLYLLSKSDFAQLLPSDYSFLYLPFEDLSKPYPAVEATDKGVLGAVKYMHEYWGESSAPGAGNWCGQHVLDPLAIRLEVAHWLWGYGSRMAMTEQPRAAPAEIDYAMLATRKQLIEAFGSFTGINMEWFKNIKDTPALLAARKVAGQGGRGHIAEPLFCPFEVMQWMANPARRKGRKLSQNKAWELLERNFSHVYSYRSVGDPRQKD